MKKYESEPVGNAAKTREALEGKRGEVMKILEQLGTSPAPWSAKNLLGYRVFNHERFELCDSDSVFSFADAHLIAAAPALYKALAAAPELYEALAAMLSCAEKEAPFTKESGMSIAMDMARKAIKKAGGEE